MADTCRIFALLCLRLAGLPEKKVHSARVREPRNGVYPPKKRTPARDFPDVAEARKSETQEEVDSALGGGENSIEDRIVKKYESESEQPAGNDSAGEGSTDSGVQPIRAEGSTETFDSTRRKVESGVRSLVLKRLARGQQGSAAAGVRKTADQIRRFRGPISANWDALLKKAELPEEII